VEEEEENETETKQNQKNSFRDVSTFAEVLLLGFYFEL